MFLEVTFTIVLLTRLRQYFQFQTQLRRRSLARWPRCHQQNEAAEGRRRKLWSAGMTLQCGSSFVSSLSE